MMAPRPLLTNHEIAGRYMAGISLGRLAIICGTSPVVIRRILDLQHVPVRSAMDRRAFARADRQARVRNRTR